MLYKDACNEKSNQKNLGTIRCSNLCTEIMEYTSKDEVAVCNLASIALPSFVMDGKFNHQKLFNVVQVVTRNLNKIIDINFYPVKEAERSNLRHRPIGIGVQGLADTFLKLRLPFDSAQAQQLNRDIFETIYFGALTASNDLSKQLGPYETYAGSPVSQGTLELVLDAFSVTHSHGDMHCVYLFCAGILQYDMWNAKPSDRWDWTALKAAIAAHGVRNSLLVAPMPTASTSQILGFNECFEPYTSNIYLRRTLAGEFICVNPWLLRDLIAIDKWNEKIKNKLIAANGSVQNIAELPTELKELYKTVWELKGRTLVDMAADRGAFIDQSQSFNVFMADVSPAKLTSLHFYAWKKG